VSGKKLARDRHFVRFSVANLVFSVDYRRLFQQQQQQQPNASVKPCVCVRFVEADCKF